MNKKNKQKTIKIPLRYLPRHLSKKEHIQQKKELLKSRKAYRKNKGIKRFYTRKKIISFKSRPSKFVKKAMNLYHVTKIGPTPDLAKSSGCSVNTLKKIIKKGEGAYFSSGSRPNQTAQSWGIARLASSLTAGKASVIDYSILKTGCRPGSKGLKMTNLAVKKYGKTLRKSPKIK